MKKALTYKQKLSWLRKNKVKFRKDLPAESTVNRLYSFYQKNSLSTPKDIAMGMGKRIEQKIERNGEETLIQTPKGKIKAKNYYKKISEKSIEDIKQTISPRIKFEGDIYRMSKRVNDYLTFRTSLTCNKKNFVECLEKVRTEIIPTIMDSLIYVLKRRRKFYVDSLVMGKIQFNNVDTERLHREHIEWAGNIEVAKKGFSKDFEDALFNAIERGFEVVYRYETTGLTEVTLTEIEIIISPRFYSPQVELLRATGR